MLSLPKKESLHECLGFGKEEKDPEERSLAADDEEDQSMKRRPRETREAYVIEGLHLLDSFDGIHVCAYFSRTRLVAYNRIDRQRLYEACNRRCSASSRAS